MKTLEGKQSAEKIKWKREFGALSRDTRDTHRMHK